MKTNNTKPSLTLLDKISVENLYLIIDDGTNSKSQTLVNQETFNNGMKNRIDASVHRETIVIEEDLEVGKVILKKYVTCKSATPRKFKNGYEQYKLIDEIKEYTSLTLNRNEPGFSIYHSNNNTPYYVRVNIVNDHIIFLIRELLSSTLFGSDELNRILTTLIRNTQPNYKISSKIGDDKDVLTRYVLSRFLSKYEITYNTNDIINVAKTFRFNKKLYRGMDIADYISDINYINNPDIVKKALGFKGVNMDNLSIYNKLGYNWADITSTEEIYNNVIPTHPTEEFYNDWNIIFSNGYTRAWGMNFITKHRDVLRGFDLKHIKYIIEKAMYLEEIYGITLKPGFSTKLADFFDEIFESLRYSTESTGVYYIKNSLISSIKRHLRKKYRAGVKISNWNKQNIGSLLEIRNVSGKTLETYLVTPSYINITFDALDDIHNQPTDDLHNIMDRVGKKIYNGEFGLNVSSAYSISKFEEKLCSEINDEYIGIFKESICYINK